MNPQPPRDGWGSSPGQASGSTPRPSEQAPRSSQQPGSYPPGAPAHHQHGQATPIMPPSGGSYYAPHAPSPANNSALGAPPQPPPPPPAHRPTVAANEQGGTSRGSPQPHATAGYSMPSINQPVEGQALPPMSSAGQRERDAQDARERDRDFREREYEAIRREQQQRDREAQEQQAQQARDRQQPSQHVQAEPMQLHQPVAVGPQMRSAIHNGILNHSGPAPSNQNPAAPPTNGHAGLFSPQYDRPPQGAAQQFPVQNMLPFPSGTPGMSQMTVQGVAPAQQPILNDALSYLDQVKVQFSGDPHVYNQFLDIMKDFKSQAIDTPGVIRRVSSLFTGHPNLIQGFNTFLPPGYRIECGTEDDPNAIRVTTPMGTQVSPMGSAIRPPSNPRNQHPSDAMGGPRRDEPHSFEGATGADGGRWGSMYRPTDQSDSLYPGRAQPGGYLQQPGASGGSRLSPFPGGAGREGGFGANEVMLARQQEARNVSQLHDAAVSAATTMSPMPEPAAPLGAGLGMMGAQQSSLGMEKRGPVEFNHAISYVNKIKNRFAQQPEIYKQFLEILQTYQRESKPIQDVYAQVTHLFDGAPDLLQDFKQFLPDSAAHAKEAEAKKAAEDATMISNLRGDAHHTPRAEQGRMPPMGNFAPTPSAGRDGKRKRGAERQGMGHVGANGAFNDLGPTGKNGYLKRGKHAQLPQQQQQGQQQAPLPPNQQLAASKYAPQPDAPPVEPMLVPQLPEPMQPATSASASSEELAFFDRVKKHISNKNAMNEFLKLCNLYSQDLIDKNLLIYRAQTFIGSSPELFEYLKRFINYDGRDQIIENRARPISGRVNLNNCRSLGQSYRHLPQRERQKPCSGRDDMCYSVLNDEWISHPTWASEDSGFIVHKKNVHEEGLHRIEEERHDYDLNISSLERFIQFLEPYAQQNKNMADSERGRWQLSPEFAGQSLPIYRKVLTKVYGREAAHSILGEMTTRPANVIPVILQRCRMSCEQWKATQREWEKVWRDQTQRMFWKSLDHQGISAKQGDKRQFQTKTLQNEVQAKFEEQKRQRLANIKGVPTHQFEYQFVDEEVLLDASRLIMYYADQNHSVEVPNLMGFLKDFIPLFFGFDAERFQEQMDTFASDTPPDEEALASAMTGVEDDVASEDSSASRGRRTHGKKSDLRRGVLDRGRTGRSHGNVERSASASRATTPDVASPADEDRANAMDDDAIGEPRPQTWVKHAVEGNIWRNREVKPNQPFKRQIFHLYSNVQIFCFFRMFTTFYDRLYKLKLAEPQVRDTVWRMKASKPAVDLRMVDKDPDNFFTDTSPSADYYKQVLIMFEELVKNENGMEMAYIEDVLRRFYLNNGWLLYSFERMLSAVTRFAIAVIAPESKDRSGDILALFNKDRKKAETTHQDELAYRKQVEKYTKDNDLFRIAYNQTTRLVTIRLLKSADPTFDCTLEDGLLDDDQRWAYYVASYTSYDPTEGVPRERLGRPIRRAHVRQAEAAPEQQHQQHQRSATKTAAAPAANGSTSAADDADDTAAAASRSQSRSDAAAHGGKVTWRSDENLGVRISPDTYRIFYPKAAAAGSEWWVSTAPAGDAAAASDKPDGGAAGKAGAGAAANAGAAKDAPAKGAGKAGDAMGLDGAADEHDGEDGSADHAFEEKFVMNNRWMAGLRRDEVDERNAQFRSWIGSEDTVMEG